MPPDMETKDTVGAQSIMDTLLDNDPRPVHVLSWGGANTTASASWKLKTEYPREKFDCVVLRTPSFLHLVNNGLEAHLDYALGGWGGRSSFDDPTFPNHINDKTLTDDGDRNKMYWPWIPAAQNDSSSLSKTTAHPAWSPIAGR